MALSILRLLNGTRGAAPHGRKMGAIATALRTDPLQIEPVLEVLVGLDWVGRLDEPDGARHVLMCDPARTPVSPLVDSLLLTPGAATESFRERSGLAGMTLADALG